MTFDEAVTELAEWKAAARPLGSREDNDDARRKQPALAEAALTVLEHQLTRPGPLPAVPDTAPGAAMTHAQLTEWALYALTGIEGAGQALLERVVFRVRHPANYRTFIRLLPSLVSDAQFEEAVIAALSGTDEAAAAAAISVQYAAWGFSVFRLSAAGAKRVASEIAALHERARPGGAADRALETYQAPSPSR